jgi:hypothetical protein
MILETYRKIRISPDETRDEHRVVVESHIGRRLGYNEVVHHINGRKRDNRIENLEVTSRSDHSRSHGLARMPRSQTKATRQKLSNINRGAGHPQSKLNEETVRLIRRMVNDEQFGVRATAKHLGVSHVLVSQVARGVRWGHVPSGTAPATISEEEGDAP